MKSNERYLFSLVNIIIFLLILSVSYSSAGTLLQPQHLTYEGAFRVPHGNLGGASTYAQTLARGGAGLTYNEKNNSLILISRYSEKLAVEISIPTPLIGVVASLNTATVVQEPGDIANSQWNNLTTDSSPIGNGGLPGGLLVYNNKLIGSAYAYYDGGYAAARSHFTSSLQWATNGAEYQGMYRVGVHPINPSAVNGGFVGGYMAEVPNDWKSLLGYPALTGKGALAIIGRTSMGPSVWGFDPDALNATDPADAEFFIGYPSSYPTIGTYQGPSLLYNMATQLNGLVFPSGSDSLLFFGRHGLGFTGDGAGCYGLGVSDPALHGTYNTAEGVTNCYDPVNSGKGEHGYPYVHQVWAYDANEILRVKKGLANPWDLVPYAYWNFDLPYDDGTRHEINGVAYDSTSQRIFISQSMTDSISNPYEPYPIIHVFKLDIAAAPQTEPVVEPAPQPAPIPDPPPVLRLQ